MKNNIENKKHNNIHLQFISMCEAIYKTHTPMLKRHDYAHRSLAYSTTLLFLKHFATAEKLTSCLKELEQDILSGKDTPATLLARACYSRKYIHLLVRAEIRRHMRLATDILEMVPKNIQAML